MGEREGGGMAAVAAPLGVGGKPVTALNAAEVDPLVHVNRAHAIVYSCALLALFYHRALSILNSPTFATSFLLITLTLADLVLAFMWILSQAFRWRPVRRREFPGNLSRVVRREDWPAIDVFICTADPYKEPPLSVVNTALSVMAFDYPTEKLSVYVSDDGGSQLTLFAFMEAARFAQHWLPFCRERGIADRSPEAYFASQAASGVHDEEMKMLHQGIKQRIEVVLEKGSIDPDYIVTQQEIDAFEKWEAGFSRQEHPSIIQVLLESSRDVDVSGHPLPNLIYVSREKSRTSPHHFKAGALNALIRVSGFMTNAPVILTLDCDMYSNDPGAPQRALCYLLDPSMSSKLAYVQFPQRFRGINQHDIYGGELKYLYQIHPKGMDGFQGPYYLGSACFFSRTCLYYSSPPSGGTAPNLTNLNSFSTGSQLSSSISSDMVLKKAHEAASCSFESGTKWGSTLGIRYGSLSEDYHTGYHLHCKGWVSVFCDPPRPAFLGDVPITLNDVLIQNRRWSIGLSQVAFSKCSPLVLGIREGSLPMAMCYARYAQWASWCVPMSIYALLPQIALVYQVPLFPKVSSTWFYLYAYLFLTAYTQDLVDFIRAQGTIRMWWNDQRMWMIRGVTSNLFGVIQFFLEKVGISGFAFNVTSKVIDDQQTQRYETGFFDFGAESSFFVSLATVATINLVSLAVGIGRSLTTQAAMGDMLIQVLISGFVAVNCWPIYEASTFRRDEGRMPPRVLRSSVFLSGALFFVAHFVISSM